MKIRTLTETDAEAVATWRYPGRYQIYDVGEVVTSEAGFWAVEHDGTLVGFCCFDREARVPGAVEEAGILDIGYGMRPDLMGQGLGREFVGADPRFRGPNFSPSRLRLLILDWNDRSRKVAVALGFESEGVVHNTEGDFLVMTRAMPGAAGCPNFAATSGRVVAPGSTGDAVPARGTLHEPRARWLSSVYD